MIRVLDVLYVLLGDLERSELALRESAHVVLVGRDSIQQRLHFRRVFSRSEFGILHVLILRVLILHVPILHVLILRVLILHVPILHVLILRVLILRERLVAELGARHQPILRERILRQSPLQERRVRPRREFASITDVHRRPKRRLGHRRRVRVRVLRRHRRPREDDRRAQPEREADARGDASTRRLRGGIAQERGGFIARRRRRRRLHRRRRERRAAFAASAAGNDRPTDRPTDRRSVGRRKYLLRMMISLFTHTGGMDRVSLRALFVVGPEGGASRFGSDRFAAPCVRTTH